MDLEQTAIERLRMASEMSLRLYKQPLVVTYSGGKDSDVLLHLAGAAGGSRPAFAGRNRKSANPVALWRPCTGINPSG